VQNNCKCEHHFFSILLSNVGLCWSESNLSYVLRGLQSVAMAKTSHIPCRTVQYALYCTYNFTVAEDPDLVCPKTCVMYVQYVLYVRCLQRSRKENKHTEQAIFQPSCQHVTDVEKT
jgi:hypothetical protein